MMFQILLLIYCNDIFVVEGGGGAGEGDAGYCTNTLDRTLMTKAKKKKRLWLLLKHNAQIKKRKGTHIM